MYDNNCHIKNMSHGIDKIVRTQLCYDHLKQAIVTSNTQGHPGTAGPHTHLLLNPTKKLKVT